MFSIRMSLPVALVSMVTSNSSLATPLTPSGKTNHSRLPFEKTFSWSSNLRGYILSSFYWGYLLLSIPSGHIANKYGGRWIVTFGILWLSCLTLLVPLVAEFSPFALIALLFLEGLGSGVIPQGMVTMFAKWIPFEENSSLTAITWSGVYIGTIIGQLSAGYICQSSFMGGWRTVFYMNGAVGITWVVFWVLLVSSSPKHHPRITSDEMFYIMSSVSSRNKESRQGVPWCRLLRSRSLVIYTILSFLFGWFLYSFEICFAQYMNEILKQNVESTGLLLGLPVILSAMMANVFTRIVDLIRRHRWLSQIVARKCFTAIGFWGGGLTLFCVTLVGSHVIKIEVLFMVALGLFVANYAGYYNTPLDKYSNYSGTVFGIGNFSTTSAGIICPIVIGHLASDQSVAKWCLVLYLNSGMALFGGLIYVLFENTAGYGINQEKQVTDEHEPLLTDKGGILYS